MDRAEAYAAVVVSTAFAVFLLAFAYWVASWGYAANHPVYWDRTAGAYVRYDR
jgi:hypothetical protein